MPTTKVPAGELTEGSRLMLLAGDLTIQPVLVTATERIPRKVRVTLADGRQPIYRLNESVEVQV